MSQNSRMPPHYSPVRYLHIADGGVLPLLTSCVIVALYGYFDWDNVTWEFIYIPGVIALPVVFRLGTRQRSHRYLWPVLALVLTLLVVRSSTIFYFACCCAILLVWESSVGKRSILALLLLAALSAFARHISYVWSFPIRIQLGAWAARAFSALGMPVEAQGNVVVFDGQPFSIDPACMGLHLLMTTMVLGIFVMAVTESQTQRRSSAGAMVVGFSGLLLLAVFANFVRILALILFRVMPGDPMHDILGLLSLGVYALLPFYVLWRWWSRHRGQPIVSYQMPESASDRPRYLPLWYGALVLMLTAVGWQFRTPAQVAPVDMADFDTHGYRVQQQALGVYQLSHPNALVYIKPPVRAFQGGHDPRICWQGSGYTFNRIHTRKIGTHTIYQALLELEDAPLYTAWWYDNGVTKTIDEWEWRTATLRGEAPFRLINVTASDAARLDSLVSVWIK